MKDRRHSFPNEPAASGPELSRTRGTSSGQTEPEAREVRAETRDAGAGEAQAEKPIEASARGERRSGARPEDTETADSGENRAPGEGAEDRRSPGGGQEAAGEARDGPEAGAEEIRALDDEALLDIKRRAEERDRLREDLLRAKADLDNYQKRVRRERPNWEGQALRQFLLEILPVVDNFERALSAASEASDAESLRQGVEMIYVMLKKTLEENGVEEIRSLGETFDPQVHEAVAQVEVEDGETGSIVEVHQKGYMHKGVVVRPSRVTVARKATTESS